MFAEIMGDGSDHEPTHQICFCTLASLYALEPIEDTNIRFAIDDIAEAVLNAMVSDLKMAEADAIRIFYVSKLYENLVNADTLFWQKSWQEIFNMFREEIFAKTS